MVIDVQVPAESVAMKIRVEADEPPVQIHIEPFGLTCVGVSDVASIVRAPLYTWIGTPAATAPAVAGTAVPDFKIAFATEVKPPVRVASPVIVVAGVIVTAPVEIEPIPIVPVPNALTVKLAATPEEITATATVPAAVAPVTFNPAACEPVEESTLKAGLVSPLRPTAKACAEEDVIVPKAVKEDPLIVVPDGSLTVAESLISTGCTVINPLIATPGNWLSSVLSYSLFAIMCIKD